MEWSLSVWGRASPGPMHVDPRLRPMVAVCGRLRVPQSFRPAGRDLELNLQIICCRFNYLVSHNFGSALLCTNQPNKTQGRIERLCLP